MANENAKMRRPAHKIRAGLVEAKIWCTQMERHVRYTVTVRRIERDGDLLRSTRTFTESDLTDLARAALEAHAWIRNYAAGLSSAVF